MKLKGINPFEQHVEKLVLGVVTLLLLAVVAMQFVLRPNAVEVNGRQVGPDQIYSGVSSEAQRLKASLDDLSPALPEVMTPDLLGEFVAAVAPDASANPRLAAALGAPLSIDVVQQDWDPNLPVAPMRVPEPTQTIASAYVLTLDPFEVASVPGLSSILGEEQPFDVRSVTVEARVNGQSLREQLEGAEVAEGSRPMNIRWWRDALAIVRVETERERFDPVSGGWVERTLIERAPGMLDPMGDAISAATSGRPSAEEVLGAVRAAGSSQAGVQRPAFYRTIAGEAWRAPSERGSVLEAIQRQERVLELNRSLADLDGRLAQVTRSMAEPRTGPEPRGGSSTGGGRQGGSSTTDRTTPSAEEQRRARLEREIAQLNERREALLVQLAAVEPEAAERERRSTAGRPGQGAPGFGGRGLMNDPTLLIEDVRGGGRSLANRPPQRAVVGDDEAPFLYNADLPVWIHDLGVEPGERYRYRVRIVLNNPMYERAEALGDAQRDLASEPFTAGPWGAWSEPVDVDPELYFFVQTASDRSALSTEPQAGIDMYRYWYGYWREGDALFRPGTPLSVSPIAPQGLVVPDPDAIDPSAFFQLTGELERYRLDYTAWRDARQRGTATPEPEPGGRTPNDPRRTPNDPANPAGSANLPPEPEKPELPEGVREVSVGRLATGVFLLDVSRLPIPRYDAFGTPVSGASEVLFLQPDGRVISRSPEADSTSLAYRRVRLSAQAGQEQGLDLSPSP